MPESELNTNLFSSVVIGSSIPLFFCAWAVAKEASLLWQANRFYVIELTFQEMLTEED